MNYYVVTNTATGQSQLFAVPADHPDPQAFISQALGNEWTIVDFDNSGMVPIDPTDEGRMSEAGTFIRDSEIQTGREQGTIPATTQTSGEKRQAEQNRQTEVWRGMTMNPSAPQEATMRPTGLNLKAGVDINGNPLTNQQIRTSNLAMQSDLEAQGLPTTDQYGRPITDPSVTMMNQDQMNSANRYTPGQFSNPYVPREINDGSNGLGGPSFNPSNPPAGSNINPVTGQPYTVTDQNVDLNTMFNQGATPQDIARYYNKQNNLDGSMHGDFVSNNWEMYDDLWALQNPGMAMPDQMGMYNNASQFMTDMGGNGDVVGVLNGQQLWDNQFSDPYMQSERARGSGDNFDATAQSQYEQVVTNVLALQPSMGSTNAQMIVGMIDRSYEDYRDLALRNDPTVSGMSFVQYLKSIGAEDWF